MDRSPIEHHLERLKETMQEVVTTARNFPTGYAHHKPDEVAFSATEIIYHLVEVEALWQNRIATMRPDLVDVNSIDPDQLARENNYNVQVYSTGIEAFQNARRHTFDVIRDLRPEQLTWRVNHPKYGQLDIGKILEIMTNHDLGHAAQFGRTRFALGI